MGLRSTNDVRIVTGGILTIMQSSTGSFKDLLLDSKRGSAAQFWTAGIAQYPSIFAYSKLEDVAFLPVCD